MLKFKDLDTLYLLNNVVGGTLSMGWWSRLTVCYCENSGKNGKKEGMGIEQEKEEGRYGFCVKQIEPVLFRLTIKMIFI